MFIKLCGAQPYRIICTFLFWSHDILFTGEKQSSFAYVKKWPKGRPVIPEQTQNIITLRVVARENNISQKTVGEYLKKENLHTYNIHLVHELNEGYQDLQMEFYETLLNGFNSILYLCANYIFFTVVHFSFIVVLFPFINMNCKIKLFLLINNQHYSKTARIIQSLMTNFNKKFKTIDEAILYENPKFCYRVL